MDERVVVVVLGAVVGLFERGVLRLVEPVRRFGVGEVEGALRYLQSGRNAGKVVVEVGEGEVVKVSFLGGLVVVSCHGMGFTN